MHRTVVMVIVSPSVLHCSQQMLHSWWLDGVSADSAPLHFQIWRQVQFHRGRDAGGRLLLTAP